MTVPSQPNYLLLTEACAALRESLRPYVEHQLRGAGPGWWKDYVLPNVSPLSRERLPRQPVKGERAQLGVLDLADLLQLVNRNWANVFRGRLGDAARAYAQELYDTRNLWAHKGDGDVSRASAERAIDTAALLLDGVDRKAAAAMRGLKTRPASAPTGHADEPTAAAGAAGATNVGTDSSAQSSAHSPAGGTAQPDARAATHAAGARPPAAAGAAGLPSWRDVAVPRGDVRSGALSQGQFAADLAEVARGNPEVGSEYLKPDEFFTRTYVTAGVRAFLKSALLRLNGSGGDPVIQLKTGFGGGKSHTMLALFHLAKGGAALAGHEALRELFAEAGGPPERANLAVLVGTHIDPTTPFTDDPDLRSLGIQINTLWGRMAWQLGGFDGYMLLHEADESGVAPGAETLQKLFRQYAPCVVLIDELVAFARKLPTGRQRQIAAGSFESNLSFIQSLTEAAKVSPRAVVAASIPESDMEIGGVQGQQALQRIENTFGRVETPWTPVEATEAFEVVRRRLFERVDADRAEQIVNAFARLYSDNATDFPVEARERAYEERMRRAYPFHPELFDRLYEDWNAAIPNFQSTRGVLRLLAGAVQRLWLRGDAAPMIMPGGLPLESPVVRDELMRYLAGGYQSVIEGDIDGDGAEATAIDAENPRFARAGAARAAARTIFLGSVPGKATQGIEDTRVRLGAVRPAESVATYNDAIGRLSQRLQFLYGSGTGRYWFEVRPNLTRTASDRMSRCSDDDVFRFLEERLKQERDRGSFAGKHVAPPDSADVPDDTAVRLVVVSPRYPFHPGAEEPPALRWARQLLDQRGNAPRLNRNMLVFAALEEEGLPGLMDATKQQIAWDSIVRDRTHLNLDENQAQQATKNRDDALKKVEADLRTGYRWALVPARAVRQAGERWTAEAEAWKALDIAGRGLESSAGSLAQRLAAVLEAEERLQRAYSPMFLARELERWFWSQGLEQLSVRKLWEENLCRYTYFPRLASRDVLAKAIVAGATTEDYFGYADGAGADGRYLGLRIGERPGGVRFDGEDLIVRRTVALAQKAAVVERAAADDRGSGGAPTRGGADRDRGPDTAGGLTGGADVKPPQVRRPTRFYGSARLNPLKLGSSAGVIGDEVVKLLAGLVGSEVEVVLEVRARVPEGIPEQIERAVSENARQLKFQPFEFEEE